MHIHEKSTVWEGRFLRTVNISYADSSGNMRTWEAVERLNCSGIVTIVPVSGEGDILLVRQFRPVVGRFVVEFPAGLNDRNESLLDAARRELIEETGYTADEFIYLAEGPISSGLSSEVLTVFLARNITPATDLQKQQYPPDESEDIEIIKIPLSDIYERLRKFQDLGDFVDLKIYGLAELAKKALGSGPDPNPITPS
ncbi:MAG: NUDIX hydrolase [Nitrospirae bacterium]|nr:NUDIX hydrolase [Nitrospirota bacterium]